MKPPPADRPGVQAAPTEAREHRSDPPDRTAAVTATLRLDKWLWVARLFKTRALAAAAADRGRVLVNGQPAKPARAVKAGDRLLLRDSAMPRELVVLLLGRMRGPAREAQLLYAETDESLTARQRAAEARRLGAEPASTIDQGRPTKRDRRRLADWQRWSASADDLPDAS